jgi:N4-gp56 family major capsid protein
MAGQATQLASGSTVVITGVGASQVPPAAPATGVSVYPTFVFGENAYGAVELDSAKFEYLKEADKSDPHNQLRLISWKIFYGMMILNQAFMMRIETGSAFSPQYDSGAVAGVTY